MHWFRDRFNHVHALRSAFENPSSLRTIETLSFPSRARLGTASAVAVTVDCSRSSITISIEY